MNVTPRAPRSGKKMGRKNSSMGVAPTSPVAMGKALVLLATSCAALSGHPGASVQRGHHRAAGHRLHRNGNGEFHSSVGALRYRDGDEDQPVDMRAANRGAVDAAAATATKKKDGATAPTPARTPYFNVFTFTLPSMPRMPASPSKEEQEQLRMDEYIEFYERRYSRMHPEHQQRRQARQQQATRRPRVVLDMQLPRKIFLSTLMLHRAAPLTIKPTMPAEPRTVGPAQEEEEDPLNVLGLSNLASKRLRQRLHVPRDLRDEHTLITSSKENAAKFLTYCVTTRKPIFHAPTPHSAEAAEDESPKNSPASSKSLAAAGGRASSYAALSFPAQLRLLLATLRRLAVAFANTTRILTAFAKSACEQILDKGGFRNTMRLAGVASVAVLLMFKPLFRGALKQG